jgi:hypothetical protein
MGMQGGGMMRNRMYGGMIAWLHGYTVTWKRGKWGDGEAGIWMQ